MYDEMTNMDFVCTLQQKAYPNDNPSAEHADLMDEAARRITKLTNHIIKLEERIDELEEELTTTRARLSELSEAIASSR